MNKLFLALCFAVVQVSEQGLDQKRLLRDLFEVRKHNVLERPVRNESEPITVSIAFNLQQIINLDEKDQFLDSSVWIEQYWFDHGLIWNPPDYGGISRIRLAPTVIWRPDILMYNSANEKFDGTWPVNVIVESSGFISYIPPAMLRSICKVNIRWFPFDEQYCSLRFGSWTYDDAKVNITLNLPSILEENYVKNGEFELVERQAVRQDNPFNYGGVTENYPFITLCFHLHRMSLYYYFNLIIPAAVITIMAILVFTLPVDSGEKMGLSVTILLSLTVFNLVVAEFVPRTSEALPLLGIYFTMTMTICSVAVATSVWVLNLYYFPTLSKNPPDWIRYGICFYLARFLRMEIPKELTDSAKMFATQQRVFRTLPADHRVLDLKAAMPGSLMANVLDMDDDDVLKAIELEPGLMSPQSPDCLSAVHERDLRGTGASSSGQAQSSGDGSAQNRDDLSRPMSPVLSIRSFKNGNVKVDALKTPETELASEQEQNENLHLEDSPACKNFVQYQRILRELKVLANQVREDGSTDMIRDEWRFASRVIDRACLLVFSIVNVCCTVLVLFSRPTPRSGADEPPGWPC